MSFRAGYLMLEVALVIACILVLVSIGLPHMALLEQRMVNYEIALMRQFFTATAQRAMATGIPQEIILDPYTKSYASGGFKHYLAQGVEFGCAREVTSSPSDDGNPVGITTFAHHKITCFANGSLQCGTVYLTNTQHSVCSCLTVPVGNYLHIRTYRYTNSQWKRIE